MSRYYYYYHRPSFFNGKVFRFTGREKINRLFLRPYCEDISQDGSLLGFFFFLFLSVLARPILEVACTRFGASDRDIRLTGFFVTVGELFYGWANIRDQKRRRPGLVFLGGTNRGVLGIRKYLFLSLAALLFPNTS